METQAAHLLTATMGEGVGVLSKDDQAGKAFSQGKEWKIYPQQEIEKVIFSQDFFSQNDSGDHPWFDSHWRHHVKSLNKTY